MYTVWVDILGYGIPVIYDNIISYRYLIRPGDFGRLEASGGYAEYISIR